MKSFLVTLLLPLTIFAQTSIEKGKTYIDSKQFAKAEQELSAYVTYHSANLEAIELLGVAYGHQKKWDEAAAEYKKLVNTKPNTANYHYKLGGALGMKALSVSKISALGIIGDVKSSFLKAAELDPNHIEARWALVELYMQLPGIIGGSKSKSFKYANELENLSKVDGYLAKGYIYEYDDEPELAEEYYLKAIKVGGSLTCYDKLTALYEKEKQPEKAVSNLEAAQIKHQRNSLHYQIGKVCADYNVQLDKGERCLKVYIQNYSAKDGVPKAWANYRLAQIYKHKQDVINAKKYIDLAIAELPSIDVFKTFKQGL
jgi:tetratricopeptide (TPR) repeat protein